MKQIKRIFVVLTALALCVGYFLSAPIAAQAEGEPVTYYLKDVAGEWRFQVGGWDEKGSHHELYYMYFDLKDGDLMVIDGTIGINLTIDVKLKNLTILNSPAAVVSTKGVDEFYALNGSASAITGDVNRADVYDGCVVNFNSNVKKLNVYSEKTDLLSSTVAVVGTADHVYAGGVSGKHFEFYNFAPGSLLIEKGTLKTASTKYSTQPSAGTSTTTPAAPSDQYDEVPKTTDVRLNPMWLVLVAGVCFAGSYVLKKKAH